MPRKPLFYINSSAPTRICDNGGWTDTWYARYGRVFHVAIEPRTHVQIAVHPRRSQAHKIVISAKNFGDTYVRSPGAAWQKHPLIEAAVDLVGVPEDQDVHITLYSDAPPGASIGTSASLTVALLGALNNLNAIKLDPYDIARQAHQVETEKLGGQSGIQDQLAAVFGGINYIEMESYPSARVTSIRPPDAIRRELERRLVLVVLGQPHKSSEVHEKVVAHLQDARPEDPRFEALRSTVAPARDALLQGDFDALGQAFIENTEAQRNLHVDLVNSTAQRIIDLAGECGAAGWKVNGAGGDGGSVAVLLGSSNEQYFELTQFTSRLRDCRILKPKLTPGGLVCDRYVDS